jgi:hypothetical protein
MTIIQTTRWSQGHGKPVVPSRWQATHVANKPHGGQTSFCVRHPYRSARYVVAPSFGAASESCLAERVCEAPIVASGP